MNTRIVSSKHITHDYYYYFSKCIAGSCRTILLIQRKARTSRWGPHDTLWQDPDLGALPSQLKEFTIRVTSSKQQLLVNHLLFIPFIFNTLRAKVTPNNEHHSEFQRFFL